MKTRKLNNARYFYCRVDGCCRTFDLPASVNALCMILWMPEGWTVRTEHGQGEAGPFAAFRCPEHSAELPK